MSRAKFIWCLKLLGCVVLVFVVNNVFGPLKDILWWMSYNAGRTHDARGLFNTKIHLLFVAALGFLLGLFPLDVVRRLFNAILGSLHRKQAGPINESDMSRPILWAWLPFALIWIPKFVFYSNGQESVFGSSGGISHWDFFFGNYILSSFGADQFTLSWMWIRAMLTGPMILAACYSLAVIARLKFRQSRTAISQQAES